MLFNSTEFAIFFLTVFALYYSPAFKHKQVWLLIAASLIFYGWGQPDWLILLICSIAINAIASWRIMSSESRRAKITWASACITLDVLMLCVFKYAALISSVLSRMGNAPTLFSAFAKLSLPIGISFYTFEGISLLVDSIKRPDDTPRENSLQHVRNTSLFFSFFPHLAAGPIVRPHQLYPQMGAKELKDIDWRCAFESLVLGYFFKNVVADNLAVHTSGRLGHFAAIGATENLIALAGVSARLFADFAGYSLIAIGLAAALGYKLPINFNFPYRSQSLAEFWTRWHITLSLWIRDYLYIPLGGNQKGTIRTYVNLLAVMILGGLWHGGKIGFAVWGLYHGVALCIERALGLNHKGAKSVIASSLRMICVFLIVTTGWLIFSLPLHLVPPFCQAVINNWYWKPDYQEVFLVWLFSLPVLIWHATDLLKGQKFLGDNRRHFLKDLAFAVMIFLVITDSGVPQDFVYFQF